MRLLLVLALTLPLQGCLFFFYIPGSVLKQFQAGNTCVEEHATVGMRINHEDGRVGKVTQLYGPSDRCKGKYPILADVEFS